MPLSIKDPEADRLARQLAAQMGVSITQAVIAALAEKVKQEEAKQPDDRDVEELVRQTMAIAARFNSHPVRDPRSLEEMLYDEHGLPK
jgi:antitoxin VapB